VDVGKLLQDPVKFLELKKKQKDVKVDLDGNNSLLIHTHTHTHTHTQYTHTHTQYTQYTTFSFLSFPHLYIYTHTLSLSFSLILTLVLILFENVIMMFDNDFLLDLRKTPARTPSLTSVPSSPQVGGWSFVSTPSPAPGEDHEPFVTWGNIEGTPLLLSEPTDTPLVARHSDEPAFRVPELTKRELLALKLANQVQFKKKKNASAAVQFSFHLICL
jgi:hypothetical protein